MSPVSGGFVACGATNRRAPATTERPVRVGLDLPAQTRHVDVEGAGHMVAGDDNDVFAEALVDFLSHDVARTG